jgi:hypothetical protein
MFQVRLPLVDPAAQLPKQAIALISWTDYVCRPGERVDAADPPQFLSAFVGVSPRGGRIRTLSPVRTLGPGARRPREHAKSSLRAVELAVDEEQVELMSLPVDVGRCSRVERPFDTRLGSTSRGGLASPLASGSGCTPASTTGLVTLEM